jgi:hypothetical protein
MFEVHTTKEGDRMLIAEMESMHLLYTIRLHLRMLKRILDAVSTGEEEEISYFDHLYEKQVISVEDAATMVRDHFPMLYPYLAEAFLRVPEFMANGEVAVLYGEVHSLMIVVLGRDKAIDKRPGIPGRSTTTFHLTAGNSLRFEEEEPWNE